MVPTWYLELMYALREWRRETRDMLWKFRDGPDDNPTIRCGGARHAALMDLQRYVRLNDPLPGESIAAYMRRLRGVSAAWPVPAAFDEAETRAATLETLEAIAERLSRG